MKKSIFFAVVILIFGCNDKKYQKNKTDLLIEKRLAQTRFPIKISDLLRKPTIIKYKDSISEPKIANLIMIGTLGKFAVDGDEGKVFRALRFENITDSIEDIYNLPPYILMSMIAQESSGVDLFPNALDDGGLGLCHMQPLIAHNFGLNVYLDCEKMVCKEHGRGIRQILEKYKYDRKRVIKYDDRLHPILNIDAVARILTYYASGPKIANLGPFRTALCRYAGKYNYKKYWANVKRFMQHFEDSQYIQRIEQKFNSLNKNLTIDGELADFKSYIAVCQAQNYNYGLAEYTKMQKYLPKNSIEIIKTYRKFF